MKILLPLLKTIEIELRSSRGQLESKTIWEELSNLSDWENRIVNDFILRVRMSIESGSMNFVWRHFEKQIADSTIQTTRPGYDICIASLRRSKDDIPLTDARNRLYIPNNMTVDIMDIFGLEVVQARNVAVIEALKRGAKKLLFIDDDILVPINALSKLLHLMESTKSKVVAGDYLKKIEPHDTAHKFKCPCPVEGFEEDIHLCDLCAMGFCLIDLDFVAGNVPLPLFWAFGDPLDPRYWLMGEDAFFTKNLLEYTGEVPLAIDLKIIHCDKINKKIFGGDTKNVKYASSQFATSEQFDALRTPQISPKILIGVPTRKENDPIVSNIQKLPIPRGYTAELYQVWGMQVDEARTAIVKEAIKRDCHYVLFIDDDVVLPTDAIYKMVEHIEKDGIDIISGEYTLKGIPTHSIHLQINDKKMVDHIGNVTPKEISLFENNWLVGLGCALIDIRFFKQAREPWFVCHNKNKDGVMISEDAHMSELAILNGFHIWIDRDIKCLHVDLENHIIYTPLESELGIDINSYSFNPSIFSPGNKFTFKCVDKEK